MLGGYHFRGSTFGSLEPTQQYGQVQESEPGIRVFKFPELKLESEPRFHGCAESEP
jgi:hypothetical protein